MVTMMTLELYHFDKTALQHQLQTLVAKAPRFFENTPIVVGLEHLQNPGSSLDLKSLRDLCAGFGINLIAIRGGRSIHRSNAIEAGLACLSAQPQAEKPHNAAEDSASAAENDASTRSAIANATNVTPIHQGELGFSEPLSPTEHEAGVGVTVADSTLESPAPRTPPKVVSLPVRSGQQIYHSGDLILTGPVSTGAEVLAEGNIFAFGAFRGRALAGINGDTEARIYCTRFEAELVSINGHYQMAASMDKSLWKQGVQVYIKDDSLVLQLL